MLDFVSHIDLFVGVREGAMGLLVELVKWIGLSPVQAVIDNLRTAQKAQFQQVRF
jgi:hypothetical protein